MSAITLKKIASMLNLSISTVSRALKDHPDISKNTVKRVKEISESLEYEPNANAIHLKTQNSRLFAVLVPTLSKFFYDSFISGIEEECRLNNYSLMILQNGDNIETEKANLKLCRHNRVTGVFACLSSNGSEMKEYQKLVENKIPLLFYDKVPEDKGFNKISIDDEMAATIAANALLKTKKKKILAIFGSEQLSITKRRQQAFTDALKPTKTKTILKNAHNSKDAEDIATQYLVNNDIDGIFCMSDEILTGVMISMQKNRKQKNVDIICMSDGYFPSLYFPAITYVETSGYKLAKQSYNVMTQIIHNNTPAKEYFVEPALIE
jgi:LacI family transcriptional regulator